MNIIKKEIMRPAAGFHGADKVVLTKKDLETIYSNFNKGLRFHLDKIVETGIIHEIPCYATHKHGQDGMALGYITALELAEGSESLVAIIRLTDLGKRILEAEGYKDVSVEINYVDGYGWVLTGLAFTNDPALLLGPIKVVASRGKSPTRMYFTTQRRFEMNQDQIKAMLVAIGKADVFEQLIAELQKLGAEPWTKEQVAQALAVLGITNVDIEIQQETKADEAKNSQQKIVNVPEGAKYKVVIEGSHKDSHVVVFKLEQKEPEKDKPNLEMEQLKSGYKKLEMEVKRNKFEKELSALLPNPEQGGLLTLEMVKKICDLRVTLEESQDKAFMAILSGLPKGLPKLAAGHSYNYVELGDKKIDWKKIQKTAQENAKKNGTTYESEYAALSKEAKGGQK